MNEQNLILLRELLVKEFNEEQLVALCQDIGLNYAELPGMGPYGKTREIIEAAQARHVTANLMARVRALRPEAYRAAKLPEVEPDTPPTPAAAPVAAPTLIEPQSLNANASAATPPVIEPPDTSPDAVPITAPATTTKSPVTISALSPRVRAIAVVVAVVLLAVAALTIILPKPAASPAPTATSPEGNPTPQFTAVPSVEANVLTTPELSLTATETETAPAQATVDPNAGVTPAQTISESHPAAQAVTAINDQLLAFYTGKTTANDIKPNWGGKAYQVIISFAYRTIKSKLGVDLARGKPLKVTMHYDRQPALVSDNGNTATVSTREYWGYTNPTTNRSLCDTRDYTYTLTKNGDKYQITDLKSKLVSATCQP